MSSEYGRDLPERDVRQQVNSDERIEEVREQVMFRGYVVTESRPHVNKVG